MLCLLLSMYQQPIDLELLVNFSTMHVDRCVHACTLITRSFHTDPQLHSRLNALKSSDRKKTPDIE